MFVFLTFFLKQISLNFKIYWFYRNGYW